LTQAARQGDAKRAADAGCVAYLTKPVRRMQLRRCLQQAMSPADSVERPLITQHTLLERASKERPRVLVADDDRTNQLVAARLLEKLGCRVSLASNGREAVDALSAGTGYDLVFMDCQMPVMDGFAAAREIRARVPAPPPIVALTASAMASDRERCLEAGMDDHMAKPVTAQAFTAMIDRWLGDRRNARPVAS
jgi:CheY-like chemotaxis protein